MSGHAEAGNRSRGYDAADVSRLLADRLIAGLDERPFRPTIEQLDWVWGGELVLGEAMASRAQIAACRYAGLLAGHVVRDVLIDGAPGAYARIWLCARRAFIASMTAAWSDPGAVAPHIPVPRWWAPNSKRAPAERTPAPNADRAARSTGSGPLPPVTSNGTGSVWPR